MGITFQRKHLPRQAVRSAILIYNFLKRKFMHYQEITEHYLQKGLIDIQPAVLTTKQLKVRKSVNRRKRADLYGFARIFFNTSLIKTMS
jgi:hypothetical protein